MARGPGRKFQKGQSGNPSGRPKADPEIDSFKKMTYKQFINYLQLYGHYNLEAMRAVNNDPKTTMFERIFGTVIVKAAEGDKDARRELFERLWGKVKEEIEHSGIEPGSIPQVVIQLPPKRAFDEE